MVSGQPPRFEGPSLRSPDRSDWAVIVIADRAIVDRVIVDRMIVDH